MSPRLHRCMIRVYFEDTDAGGLVYHANYLGFAERARTELLRELGLDHPTLRRRHGIIFAVRRAALEFRAPGRLDDWLEVETEIVRQGGASVDFSQRIVRDDLLIASVETRVALVGPHDRPARMPAEIKQAYARWSPRERGAADV